MHSLFVFASVIGTVACQTPPDNSGRAVAPDGKCSIGEHWVQAITATPLGDYLMIGVVVGTDNPNAKVQYKGLLNPFGLLAPKIAVVDSLGNKCPEAKLSLEMRARVELAAEQAFAGKELPFGAGPIEKDKPRVDFAFVEKPHSKAEHVDIDIDGKIVGANGVFRLRAEIQELEKPKPKTTQKPVPTPSTVPVTPAKPRMLNAAEMRRLNYLEDLLARAERGRINGLQRQKVFVPPIKSGSIVFKTNEDKSEYVELIESEIRKIKGEN